MKQGKDKHNTLSKIENKSDKQILSVASKVLERHRHAFEVLGNE